MAPLWNTPVTEGERPFGYDAAAGELWIEIPLRDRRGRDQACRNASAQLR